MNCLGNYILGGERNMAKKRSSWSDFIPSTVATLLFISQIIVGLYLLSMVSQIEIIAYCGVGLYVVSGLIFGMLPVFEFRKKGRVKKGNSYVQTTKLVTSGIYSIVRHPQFVTFILFAIAGMLLFQHWIVILLGIPIIPLTYIDLLKADKRLLRKFGDDYKHYMQRVPRANFLLGSIRVLQRKRKEA
jgi:protein-S-isoprenylcysteine O-methyltransferase Ste14